MMKEIGGIVSAIGFVLVFIYSCGRGIEAANTARALRNANTAQALRDKASHDTVNEFDKDLWRKMLDKDFSSTERELPKFFDYRLEIPRKLLEWKPTSVNVMPITLRRSGILSFLPGLGSMQKEEWDKAIADFGEAIGRDPNDTRAYFYRGEAYRQKEKWDEAIEYFSEAIGRNPNGANANFNRGEAYRQKEEWDKAIADFSEAIERDPNDTGAYFNRGKAYRQKEEWDKAIADFSEAVNDEEENRRD